MANDIQNCSELENQTTTLEQIWEKQKSETKEDIENILKSNTDEDLILKLILLLKYKHKKYSIKIHDICNELKNRKLIDIIPWWEIVCVEPRYWLYAYITPQNTFKYFSITPEKKIKHTWFEFDNNIIQIADFDYFDYNNNIFLWEISWVTHLFQLDEKDLTFNYLFTSDNNNPLVDVDATLIEDYITLHFQLNKWPIVECLWKIIDWKVKILLNNWLKDLGLKDNWLTFWTEIKTWNHFIWLLIEDEVCIFEEINKNFNFLIIDFGENKSLITITNWIKSHKTYVYSPSFWFKEIKNFNILWIKDLINTNYDELIWFLEWKKIITVDWCMYKFDVENNVILSWWFFDKKSQKIDFENWAYIPKKWFRYIDWKVYKLWLVKTKLVKEIDKNDIDDLNNYFDFISI